VVGCNRSNMPLRHGVMRRFGMVSSAASAWCHASANTESVGAIENGPVLQSLKSPSMQ
jgi:hypothetical protein